ncbi:hypothetical protein DFAR_2420001 [Desulfarculales bacterium]
MDKDNGQKLASKDSSMHDDAARASQGIVNGTTIAPGDTMTLDIQYTGLAASQVRAGNKHFSWYNAQQQLGLGLLRPDARRRLRRDRQLHRRLLHLR